MDRLRRIAPLIISVGLVLAIGGVGIAVSANGTRNTRNVHASDRQQMNSTLAGLTNQYLQFSFKEAFDHAATHPWTLRPGDPRDAQGLAAYVERSALVDHAAALLDLQGNPINLFTHEPGIPEDDDPGYQPIRLALAAGTPGISSVMRVGDIPVVAFGVPVLDPDGNPEAVLLAFYRPDRNPLQTYSERLSYGQTGVGYIVDSHGTVVAASNPDRMGGRVGQSPALQALLSGESGFQEYDRDGTRYAAAYTPIGVGGWGAIVEQTSKEFFGPIRRGGFQTTLALLLLLVVAAAGLAVLNYHRESALRHAYEYKGQLLANTTHELKTPLTAIRGAAITLGARWRDLPDGHIDQLVGMIHRRCDGLSKLVERILMGARLDAGRELPMSPETIPVGGLLRRIATEFADASPRHTFRVTVPDGLSVEADPDASDQIVGMLVENAMKYSPQGGCITLEAEAQDDHVLFRVTDPGVGIAPEEQQHIFEPYYRADRGDDRRPPGTGLGLAITRHLVRMHGGDITVVSSPGEGSIFSFTLPRSASEETGDAQEVPVEVWVPVSRAANVVGVSPSTVRAWLRQGIVRSERTEGTRAHYLVSVEDLRRRVDTKTRSKS